jgi:hypothetical protein
MEKKTPSFHLITSYPIKPIINPIPSHPIEKTLPNEAVSEAFGGRGRCGWASQKKFRAVEPLPSIQTDIFLSLSPALNNSRESPFQLPSRFPQVSDPGPKPGGEE